jgi:hypothetical protein
METNGAPERTAERPHKLSEELAGLQARFAEEAVTLRAVIEVLRGRAYLLLLILLALPFGTPIPLPGLSTPFGAVIALIALRLALGQHPWLPDRLLDRRLPPGFFRRLLTATAWIIRFFEVFLRPRLTPVAEIGLLRQLHAVVILVAALVLLLPLPIPFTNAFPAWVILFIAAGLLERDGGFIAAGYVVFTAGVGYFLFLGGAAHHLIDGFRRLLAG